MRLIFLDIDGVLVTRAELIKGYIPVFNMHGFNADCVKRLNEITNTTKAKIVISSCWRHMEHRKPLLEHIRLQGITGEIIGMTPNSKSGMRGEEIEDFLKEFKQPVDAFVILDDEKTGMGEVTNFLVYIKGGIEKGGLQDEHVAEALKILNQ